MRHFIDSHKGATGPAVLLLMAAYSAWSLPTAWLYLGMHGTYGLLWVLKSRLFPDRQWEQPVSLEYGVGVIWGGECAGRRRGVRLLALGGAVVR